MTIEVHPYLIYLPKKISFMIIGSFPIGKFSNPSRSHEIKDHEIDFFFGGERNLLWKLLEEVFETKLTSKKTIIKFLNDYEMGIGDVIKSCRRKNGSASDSDLYDISWNDELRSVLEKHQIRMVFLTSKKVEKWFNRLYPDYPYKKVLLISPSAQSIRSLVRIDEYKKWKKKNLKESSFKFIEESYRKAFLPVVKLKKARKAK